MTGLSVAYSARAWRRDLLLILATYAMAVAVTGFAIWRLAEPESGPLLARGLLLLLALASWWAAASVTRTVRARRKAIREGRPALLADETGLTFLDPGGRTRRLSWSEIESFHLHRVDGADMLYVEGSYRRLAGEPVRFNLADLDADGLSLLCDLSRVGDRPGVDGTGTKPELVRP